jgi:hypothetical protein
MGPVGHCRRNDAHNVGVGLGDRAPDTTRSRRNVAGLLPSRNRQTSRVRRDPDRDRGSHPNLLAHDNTPNDTRPTRPATDSLHPMRLPNRTHRRRTQPSEEVLLQKELGKCPYRRYPACVTPKIEGKMPTSHCNKTDGGLTGGACGGYYFLIPVRDRCVY